MEEEAQYRVSAFATHESEKSERSTDRIRDAEVRDR
jgi:hypothetical protein